MLLILIQLAIRLVYKQKQSSLNYFKQIQYKYQMDPRPYHFQYRKPRFTNPTYQSVHLYDSIYQLSNSPKFTQYKSRNPQSNRYKQNGSVQKPSSEPDTLKRNQSMQIAKPQKIDKGDLYRYVSKQQLQPVTKQRASSIQYQKNASKLSNYGYNLMKNNNTQLSIDQKQVFDKQQHNFDIINYHPTQYKARLKMFPKLTLEDKINEKRGLPYTKFE